MADQRTMRLEDVEALADKLDGLASELTDEEKALLLAVFEVAGAAIEAQLDEVQGFALSMAPSFGFAPAAMPLSQGFRNAFRPGVGGGVPTHGIIIDNQDPGDDITVGSVH